MRRIKQKTGSIFCMLPGKTASAYSYSGICRRKHSDAGAPAISAAREFSIRHIMVMICFAAMFPPLSPFPVASPEARGHLIIISLLCQ